MFKKPCNTVFAHVSTRWIHGNGSSAGNYASLFSRSARCGKKVLLPRYYRKPLLFLSRQVGSSQAAVDKDIRKKNVDLKFPVQEVTVYTCENVYDKWKKERTFFHIPSSGVFAKISYIDTLESCKESGNGKEHKTVLCIHGIPGNHNVYSHIINDLSSHGIRVIVPTFPDTLYLPGKNKTELFRHTVEEKTQVFKDFLNSLNVSKLDCIIAHSSAIYPTLRLTLDTELKIYSQVFFNIGGHKITVAMRPYWIMWICCYIYLHPFGRKFIQKTGKFIMKHILKTPIKDDNFDGVMLLGVTMIFSEYWKTKEQFLELARRKVPTLYCFSEDDKVVEKKLTYEVVSLLGASKENVSYYDEDANLREKGKNMNWLTLISFDKGSHYVFRKYPDLINQKVLQLINKIENLSMSNKQ